MKNTSELAAKWTEFIAERQEFPVGDRLLQAFHAGTITRLCDCGCNTFDMQMPDDCSVNPIAKTGGYGSIFEISFEAHGEGPPEDRVSVEFIVFADDRGHFSGIEINFCGNSYPIPENIELAVLPYHVLRSAAIDA